MVMKEKIRHSEKEGLKRVRGTEGANDDKPYSAPSYTRKKGGRGKALQKEDIDPKPFVKGGTVRYQTNVDILQGRRVTVTSL